MIADAGVATCANAPLPISMPSRSKARRVGSAHLRTAFAIALASAFTTSAIADDKPNPEARVQAASNSGLTGALTEGTGVLDRAHPEYDAEGLPAGPFLLYPTLAADLSSDDNIHRTAQNAVGDLFWTVSPRLDLKSQWSQDVLQLYAQLDNYRYDNHDTEDRTNWIAGGRGNAAVADGTVVDFAASYLGTHESRSSPDISSQALNPTAYTQLHADAAILNQPGPLGLSAGVNFDRYDYDPTNLIGGGMLDNADRDANLVEMFGKASYAFGPGSSAFVRTSYNTRAYDLRFDNNGYDHSSNGYRVDTGVQMMFTPLIKGTIYAGYLQQNFNTPLNDVNGLDFGAQIDWYATELVTVHFTAARTLTDTTIAGASSEDERSGQLSLDYELLRNLILQGNAGYEDDIFDGTPRQDHILTAGLGAKYLIDRHINLYADYTHAERNSNAVGNDFADNLVTAGIKFQY
jgi:hypothetical protein